jgi:hypothetical protein
MIEQAEPRARGRAGRTVAMLVAGLMLATTVVAGGAGTKAEAQLGCSDIEIITARGTWEPQNFGFLLPSVVRRIQTGLAGTSVSSYDVVYPAQPSFNTSAPQGITNLISHINTEATTCPDQRYVLLGYSQGGLVVSDSLVDTGRAYGTTGGTMSQDAKSKIVAVGNFGSMRFTAGRSYNGGTPEAGRQSMLPVPPGALDAFADRMLDYCVNDDWVCQGDGNFLVHLGYIFGTGQQEVADFVVDEVRAAG